MRLKTDCQVPAAREAIGELFHSFMLASLHIEDTPISYNSPRGPSTDFKVVYNQREENQPTTSSTATLVQNGLSTGCRM